jgi:hypothetical protein
MICIQLKIKCKTILLKTLENGLNKSYFMTYQEYGPTIRNQRTIRVRINHKDTLRLDEVYNNIGINFYSSIPIPLFIYLFFSIDTII